MSAAGSGRFAALIAQTGLEAVKVATLRATWWVLGVGAALAAGLCWLTARSMAGEVGATADGVTRLALRTSLPLLVAVVVVAVTTVRGDHDAGTARLSVLRAPSRTIAWAGAVLGLLAVVAPYALLVSTGALLLVLVAMPGAGIGFWSALAIVVSFVVVSAVWAVLSMVVAGAVSSTAAATAVLLAWPLVVEPALSVAGGGWTEFLPFSATFAVLGGDSPLFADRSLSTAGSAAVVALLTTAVASAGWWRLRRADL